MSKKLTDLTIDMTKLRRMPVQERLTFTKQPGVASDIFGNLTPSQIASLFPKYYMDKDRVMSGMMKATSSSYSGGSGGGTTSYSSGSGNSSGSSSSGGYTPPLSLTERLRQAAGIAGKDARVAGTGDLKDRDAKMKMVYDAYISAGLSHKQALAFTAEVGRENSYQDKYLFGTHTDLNGYTNFGMISMQKDRKENLFRFLKAKGLIDASGNVMPGQATLNAQAEFQVQEIREKYPRTAKEFLNNPDIDAEEAAAVLGDDYIRWARHGNEKIGFSLQDAAIANQRRQGYLNQITKLTENFDRVDSPATADATKPGETTNQNTNGTTDIATTNLPTDNPNGDTANVSPVPAFQFDITKLNPDLQAEYNHASESEKKTIEQAVQKIGYDKANEIRNENPTASPSLATAEIKKEGEIEKIKPVVFSQEGLQEFWKGRNPRGGDLQQVDPVLLKSYAEAAQQYEAANPNYRVEIFGPNSGTRESGSTVNHGIKADGYGKALDFVIIDKATGRQIANKGSEGYAGQEGGSELGGVEYAKLHGMARVAQEHFFPNATPLRSGIGFVGGSVPFDAMHGDITGGGMAGFNWETGYTPQQMNNYNIPQNFALGDEKRIQALGNTIYGETDENGYYKNQGMYEYNPETNTNTISAKTSAETATATVVPPDQQPSTQPAPQVNEHQQPGTAENPPNDIAPTPLNTDPDVTPPQQPAANSGAATGQDPDVTPPPPQLSGGGVVPNSAQEPLEVRDKETGQVLAQVQPNEKLTTTPNGLKVDSASEMKADETMAETNKGDPVQQQSQNQGIMRGTVEDPERTNPDKLSDLADMRTVIYSPSQARAMNQATLGGAAQHYNRGSNVG